MPVVQDRWLNKILCDNRYVVANRLDEGGMGTVYLAKDRNLQTWVVIKIPHPLILRDPEFAARFKREVRLLVALSHRVRLRSQELTA